MECAYEPKQMECAYEPKQINTICVVLTLYELFATYFMEFYNIFLDCMNTKNAMLKRTKYVLTP